jgi:NAD(P)H-dependent FMN reductase
MTVSSNPRIGIGSTREGRFGDQPAQWIHRLASQQGKSFEDFPHLAQAANGLLDDMAWWSKALKTARQAV